MTISRRAFLQMSGATVAGVGMLRWLPPEGTVHAATTNPNLHLLNRISWGAKPEDLTRLESIGYDAYLDEQLNPETIDDSVADEMLQRMPILNMDRRTIYSLSDFEGRANRAMIGGMVLRAVYSKRQLLERMVEFWTDHFNVSNPELAPDMIVMHREAIRKHAFGNFRDMTVATAKSPAMLVYLDNFINIAEAPNENYARELLELHTMGVDGGYTEADVVAAARAFTGWTVHPGTETGFFFGEEDHDTNSKELLGHTLPGDRGIADGLHVLSIIVNHPATAQFLSRKLCIRFISDNPPQSIVDSTAAVWREQRGEIRPVLRHIFTSEEFRQSAGQKLRRPLDFFVGALRATGTQIHDLYLAYEGMEYLGQVPFAWRPPDGYPDEAGRWMTTNGLLARWEVAMTLTHGAHTGEHEGLTTDLHTRIGRPQTVGELVDAVATQIFGAPLPPENNTDFIHYASDGNGADMPMTRRLLARKLATLHGLMLASPFYQWR